MYGATEATARMSYLPPALVLARLGSIGKGIPGVIDAEDVASLGSGQTRAPEPLRGDFQDRLRDGEAVVAKQRSESAQNRASGLPAKLLVDDGVDKGLEWRETAGAQFDRANAVN